MIIDKRLIDQVSEVTRTNYDEVEPQFLAEAMIDDLLMEIVHYKAEIREREQEIEDNYKRKTAEEIYEYGL